MPPLPLFLIGLGVLLLFIEIILLPGFGAAGVPAIILICAGIGIIWSEFGWEIASLYAGGTVILIIPLAILGLWIAPRTRLGRTVILKTAQNSEDGFQAPPQELATLVGHTGQSASPLRPAGVALIDGKRVDVVTSGEFIQPDTEVEVIAVEGRRVVVRSL